MLRALIDTLCPWAQMEGWTLSMRAAILDLVYSVPLNGVASLWSEIDRHRDQVR